MKNKALTILILLSNLGFALETNITCDNNNLAGSYPCQNIDLKSHLNFVDMGGVNSNEGSDLWGWTDTNTGKEYALMTLVNSVEFVDITNPIAPIYLGTLPSRVNTNQPQRDIKTYSHYAYVVSEASGHGMQIFDLNHLINVINPPVNFTADTLYTGFGHAHNIAINTDSAFAYVSDASNCTGISIFDLQNPLSPLFKGCVTSGGASHDLQCVNYIGPDADYNNAEVCFNSTGTGKKLSIINITDKNNPSLISATSYANARFTHLGWLTQDQRYFLQGDELDETTFGFNTKTLIWDVQNLDVPVLIGFYTGKTQAIDHNLYIKGNYAYQANYTSGLSIVKISDINNIFEVAYFDTHPSNDNANFNGAWSSYPYFASGTIIVSDINAGLFVLKPSICLKSDAQCFSDLAGIFKSGFE